MDDNMHDHDLLIRLEAKLDGVTQAVKDLTISKSVEHTTLEKRLKVLEDINTEYAGSKYVPMIEANDEWIHDFRLTWKIILGMTIGLSSVVTFALSVLLRAWCLFGKCIS